MAVVHKLSYETVRRWRKKVHRFCQNAAKSGRPVSATGKNNVSKVRKIIKSDKRYTVRDIVKAVGITLSRVHFILKRILKVRNISIKWISHLLTNEKRVTRTNKRQSNC